MRHHICFLFLTLAFLGWNLKAQTVIELDNPSLEGKSSPNKVPPGWYYCGPRKGNMPDLHPGGFYQVAAEARSGKTFVGLVGLPSGNPGSMGQRLSRPLVAGQCYELNLFAARSSDYVAALSTTREPTNFNKPLWVSLWAGSEACEQAQLLDQIGPVRYPDWTLHKFHFQPKQAYTHLFVTAAFSPGKAPYPGNVLIDEFSAVFPVHCKSGDYLIKPDTLYPAPINNQKDWQAYIFHTAGCLEFNGPTDSLKKAPYYWQDSQFLLFGNVALHSLALAMKYFPDQVLEIHVKGTTSGLRKRRKRSLRQYWKKLGFSGKQLRVRSTRTNRGNGKSGTENEWVLVFLR